MRRIIEATTLLALRDQISALEKEGYPIDRIRWWGWDDGRLETDSELQFNPVEDAP